jgi:hypothetical protein
MLKSAAPYVLFDGDFDVFAWMLESLKTPSGYASTIGKHLWNKKYGSLKSHDYHVLMLNSCR